VSADYTTVGHVTVDVMADGSRRPGGGAFYSALQAARLGRRARIFTRGVPQEIEALLAPYAAELDVHVEPAPHTTTLQTSIAGATRVQRMLAWAGEIGGSRQLDALDTAILHVAPVARETGLCAPGRAGFVGLTPQGLVRTWSALGAPVRAQELEVELLPRRCDAIVISSAERDSCAALLAAHEDAGAGTRRQPVLAVTNAAGPTELHLPDGRTARVAVTPIADARDDMGAGDVFAAAFFVALAEGAAAERAAGFANAAAAVRIAGVGAQAIGDRAAIDARALAAP
jgi:sugar/nucleoside kinase (ribokinase family)